MVLVFITYSNTHTYSTGSIRYQYSLRMVENTKFKAVQPIYTKNIENRGAPATLSVRCLVLPPFLLAHDAHMAHTTLNR